MSNCAKETKLLSIRGLPEPSSLFCRLMRGTSLGNSAKGILPEISPGLPIEPTLLRDSRVAPDKRLTSIKKYATELRPRKWV